MQFSIFLFRLCSDRTLLDNGKEIMPKGNISRGRQTSNISKRILSHKNKVLVSHKQGKRKRKDCGCHNANSNNCGEAISCYRKEAADSIDFKIDNKLIKKSHSLHSYKKSVIYARRITRDGEVQYLFRW